MGLVLLGRASSINVRKVLWLGDELGLALEHQPWGEGALSLRSPEFLALNPQGLVPVLRDGEAVLTESNTICRYLAAREHRADLLPEAPLARARVEQWMDWQATTLNSAWRHAFMARVRRHPDFQDPAAIARSVAEWNACMAILDARLAHTGAHVCGDDFTLADIVLGLSTQRWWMTPMRTDERPALPAIAAYTERLAARPGFMRFGRNGMP